MSKNHVGPDQNQSVTLRSPLLNTEFGRVVNLSAYGVMLGWSQTPGAGDRLHDYLGGQHAYPIHSA